MILADEPTGNLDTSTGAEIIEMLASLAADRGTTVIVATHDIGLAGRAQRRLAMRDGRLAAPVADTPAGDVVGATATLRNFFKALRKLLGRAVPLGSVNPLPRSSEMKSTKMKFAGATAAVAALVGGGAAIAADRLSPTQESDAVVADAAKQLGVDPSKLDAALKKALQNRVDAAVAAGRITKAQGDEMKARIAAGDVPLVGVGPGRPPRRAPLHHFADLDAAASYLGITEAALKTSLSDGSTLADIAKEKGKSVDGLKAALVAAAKADLAQAVKDGRLTEAQQTELLADLSDRIDGLVNGELGLRGDHGPRGAGPSFHFEGAPPAGDA